ncbi:MAG: polyprenyl synthetase family protein [Thermodesulfobacteriota bacterium]
MNLSDKFSEQIQSDIDQIEFFLKENLKSQVPVISEVNQHILLGGGKRLRALLFVLCSKVCGYSGKKAHYFSCIFEYLHGASLLHDDVIDNAELRRGKPSANTLWGNSLSILIGDFLLAKSFSMALETDHPDFLKTISRTAGLMSEGMVMELVQTRNLDIEEETYRSILTNKTAVLISAACQTGAILGNAPPKEQEALARYGLELGIAFQLIDDLLDYTSTSEQFGKPVANDFKEGKITLPLIYALKRCPEPDRQKIKALSGKETLSPEDFQFLFNVIHRQGGLAYTRQEAQKSKDKAKGYLDVFKPSPLRQLLIDLTEFVVERKK